MEEKTERGSVQQGRALTPGTDFCKVRMGENRTKQGGREEHTFQNPEDKEKSPIPPRA